MAKNPNGSCARRRTEKRAAAYAAAETARLQAEMERLAREARLKADQERRVFVAAGDTPDGLPVVWRTVDRTRVRRMPITPNDIESTRVRYAVDGPGLNAEIAIPYRDLRENAVTVILAAIRGLRAEIT
jgi:hypothetical protein